MSRYWKRNQQFEQYLRRKAAEGAETTLIVTHDNPDPDSLACAMALRRLIGQVLGVSPVIAHGGVVGRSENRAMVRKLRIPLTPINELDPASFHLVILVDTQPGTGNNSLPPEVKPNVVIDHHPRLESLPDDIEWVDIRTQYGATATIVNEYCESIGVEMDKRTATAVFYAIKTETQDLGREGVAADRRTYLSMLKHVDTTAIFEIVYAPLSREYFQMIWRGLNNARIYEDVLVTNLLDIQTADHVAETADMLLRLDNIRWTFVMGRWEGDVYLSLRTLNHGVDAGEVMKKIVAKLGKGGGHEMMAGGRILNVGGDDDFLRSVEDALTKIFLKIIKARCREGDSLVAGPGPLSPTKQG